LALAAQKIYISSARLLCPNDWNRLLTGTREESEIKEMQFLERTINVMPAYLNDCPHGKS
jgi:hypothetical protein